jgi:hypothetical protein
MKNTFRYKLFFQSPLLVNMSIIRTLEQEEQTQVTEHYMIMMHVKDKFKNVLKLSNKEF